TALTRSGSPRYLAHRSRGNPGHGPDDGEGGGDLPPVEAVPRSRGRPTGRHARRTSDSLSSLVCDGGRRSTVRPGPLEYLVADRTCARPKAATASGRGGGPKPSVA